MPEPLTNNDIADLYDKHHGGRPARTLPIRTVVEWANTVPHLIRYDENKDLFFKRQKMAKKKVKKKKKAVKKSSRPSVQMGDEPPSGSGNPDRMYLSIAKTINLGNYESLRVEFGRGMGVNYKGDAARVYDVLFDEVTNSLKELITEVEKLFD